MHMHQLLHPHHRRNTERITLEELANVDTPNYVIQEAIYGYQLRYGNDKWLNKYTRNIRDRQL